VAEEKVSDVLDSVKVVVKALVVAFCWLEGGRGGEKEGEGERKEEGKY
jgi:hypothetical protein